MAKNAPTTVPPEAESAEAAPGADVAAGPEWGSWHWTGPAGTTWTNIPLTANTGDVIAWCGPPGAGWEATDDAPTVRPDNWRPDPDGPSAHPEPVPPAGDES